MKTTMPIPGSILILIQTTIAQVQVLEEVCPSLPGGERLDLTRGIGVLSQVHLLPLIL
jgi:hypothetical protein